MTWRFSASSLNARTAPFAAFVVEVYEYIICEHGHGVPDTFYALEQRDAQGEIELLAGTHGKKARLPLAPGIHPQPLSTRRLSSESQPTFRPSSEKAGATREHTPRARFRFSILR